MLNHHLAGHLVHVALPVSKAALAMEVAIEFIASDTLDHHSAVLDHETSHLVCLSTILGHAGGISGG
jgi:hypothetical protein